MKENVRKLVNVSNIHNVEALNAMQKLSVNFLVAPKSWEPKKPNGSITEHRKK
tara:strand:+ start:332 stop:490 length:159 start_codon:yes stop_codon:yes gene_type:complete